MITLTIYLSDILLIAYYSSNIINITNTHLGNNDTVSSIYDTLTGMGVSITSNYLYHITIYSTSFKIYISFYDYFLITILSFVILYNR